MEENETVNERRSIHNTSTMTTEPTRQNQETEKSLTKEDSEILKEVAMNSVDLNVATCSAGVQDCISTKVSFTRPVSAKVSFITIDKDTKGKRGKSVSVRGPGFPTPLIIINSPRCSQHAITTQPRSYSFLRSCTSPMSLITTVPNQPPTLFMQALAKINENKLSVTLMNDLMRMVECATGKTDPKASCTRKSPELSPPDSLTSAPPSYSFVLRQSARRRPRLMGTFIPSPSFVQHTPPPNYATAFDIYVDNSAPQEPTRIYSFGFTSMPVICPECGYAGLTVVTSRINLCTHFCALILCLFCCWLCAPLPYVMRSCKDVYHHCRNCRALLGMYSPTNPDGPYPQVMS